MLVLSRRSKEKIQIGNNVVITVLEVSGQQVRLGIEAPREVRVMRSEIAAKPPRPKLAEPTSDSGTPAKSVGLESNPTGGEAKATRQAGGVSLIEWMRSGGRIMRAAPGQIRPPQRLGPATLRSIAGRSSGRSSARATAL